MTKNWGNLRARNRTRNRTKYLTLILLLVDIFTPVSRLAGQTPDRSNPTQTVDQYLQQFLLVVAPIQIWIGSTRLGTASGFFYLHIDRLYFITNRHVVRREDELFYPDRLSVRLHTSASDHSQNVDYEIPLYKNKISLWRQKPNVDLAAIELPVADMSKFVVVAMSKKWLPPDDVRIPLGNDVMIIGYPLGFSDMFHNYPVAKTGAVASAYPIAFNGYPCFIVDALLQPGTSGSPVITKPSPYHMTSSGSVIGGVDVYFLGVNSGEYKPGGMTTGLNQVWFASEVESITDPGFQSQVFAQP